MNKKKLKKISKYRKGKTIKSNYLIIILVIVLIFASVGYSYWSTELRIQGIVTAKFEQQELPVVIEQPTTDENGVSRFTSETNFTADGLLNDYELYRIINEEYDATTNTITTTLKHTSKGVKIWIWDRTYVDVTIKLKFENGSNYPFQNGTITLTDSRDTAGVFTNRATPTLESTTVMPGQSTNAVISGRFNANLNVGTNTHYYYTISFNVNGEVKNFYYHLEILKMD